MSDGTRKVRVGKLDTIGSVATEMGKIYREARRAELDTLDAVRLVKVLSEIRRGLEGNASSVLMGKISGPNVEHTISSAKSIFLDRISKIRERLDEVDCEVG